MIKQHTTFMTALFTVLLFTFIWQVSPVQANPGEQPDDFLCTPGIQLRYERQCNPTGPAERLSELAHLGILPQRPIKAHQPDYAYNYIPFHYLRGSRDGVKLYGSVADAANKTNSIGNVEPGFLFLSYIDRFDHNGKEVFMLEPGVFVSESGTSYYTPPEFQGLLIDEPPNRHFGWMMGGLFTYQAPGSEQPQTSHWVSRYDLIQIFDTVELGEQVWYMIGPDEWVEQKLVALVYPEITRPAEIPADRWIAVNLFEQTITVYENDEIIFASLVSSGSRGWWTQPGVFQIYAKLERDTMRGAFESDRSDYYYLEDVPWVMYYDGARALHGAYWHNNYGYPTSHGCINVSHADGNWLYEWAEEGTWVYVFDPTGNTPTDDES